MSEKQIEVLDLIIKDCEEDVRHYEGQPFNGKTVAEIHGILEAKILTLSKILKEIIEEK